MFKYVIAAVLLLTATPASAQSYTISQQRLTVIQKLAEPVCRASMQTKGDAGKEFDRQVAPLLLSDSEYMLMLSMCILYAQGRIDGIKDR
jgi:hypothetical protein